MGGQGGVQALENDAVGFAQRETLARPVANLQQLQAYALETGGVTARVSFALHYGSGPVHVQQRELWETCDNKAAPAQQHSHHLTYISPDHRTVLQIRYDSNTDLAGSPHWRCNLTPRTRATPGRQHPSRTSIYCLDKAPVVSLEGSPILQYSAV